MLKNKNIIHYIAGLILFLGFSCMNAQAHLEVHIEDIRSKNGDILLELLDTNEITIRAIVKKIDTLPIVIDLYDIENGTYALKFFHDSNSNKILDMNWMGIPQEGFGFSNNAYGLFMPKKFKEWLFEVKGDTTIVLIPKYLLK
ncbi:MAG: DUF2141 domain-containing protein [Candidatus Marinimicrobia bacterium]|nr:DUF2141 domain-containing protein [Candidatus Neomarinimicrobiota bacterium]